MFFRIKRIVKRVLAFVGLYHPSLGIKTNARTKADMVLESKTPEMRIFVETGTEFGTMINFVKNSFEKIYSIELDTDLYQKAVTQYKRDIRIVLLPGDSSVEIQKALAEIHEPALFWLDAHAPGALSFKDPTRCPVEKELGAIFAHSVRGHVILIDDARHFDVYSINMIKELAKTHGYRFKITSGLFKIY